MDKFQKKNASLALTSVAQLVGRHPAKQKFTGLISSQSTCLGSRAYTQLRQLVDVSHINVFSPSLSPSLSLSENKYFKN